MKLADKVIVDRISQSVRLGEIHHALDAGAIEEKKIYGELGDIVTGRLPGRENDETILCDLTGVGA